MRWLAGAGAALVLLPVLALAGAAAGGSDGLWPHLARFVLPAALAETALLLLGVGVVVVAVGTGTAWLTCCYRFPGRRPLAAALVLPLALPGYVAAYAWLDVLHPAGPVQTGLRRWLGLVDPRAIPLPEPRSLPGCALVLGMVLFPYVYLAARAAFLARGVEALRAGRASGAGEWLLFRRVGLPMARPAVAAGTALALMEALNDVGAAEILGVRTLTVSVYTTWITRSSLAGASQLALALLGVVALLLLLERLGRARDGHVADGAPPGPGPLLRGPAGLAAALCCAVPVLLGFAVPAAYLLWAAWRRVSEFGWPADLGRWIGNSATLAAAGTALALMLALPLALGARRDAAARRAGPGLLLLKLGMLGYALPGGVLAVGLIVAFGRLDDLAADWVPAMLAGWAPSAWAPPALSAWAPPALSGSALALVLAYAARFLAIPAGGLDAAYGRIGREVDWSAASLGAAPWRLLRRVHLPLLRPALWAAALLVFLDAMKELPATLLLRPLNTETLATALFAEAARGTYEDGAVAALALALVGLLPVGLLLRRPRG